MKAPAPLPRALDLIGNTPLVRLAGPSEAAGCDIYGKCEFANPGGSVKDRAALWIIRDAEARGELKPGGTIVEGTAGNTGIGIALVANAPRVAVLGQLLDHDAAYPLIIIQSIRCSVRTLPRAATGLPSFPSETTTAHSPGNRF